MLLFVLFLLLFAVPAIADTVNLDTIYVTPFRYAVSDGSVLSSVSVINSEDIKRSDAKTVADIVKDVPGIFLSDNSTQKTQIVDIRGGGEFANRNVLVLIDGRKVNPVDISGPDWMQIPIETVERVEVLRGGGSVLYGDNASAGVIHIITKKPTDGLHGAAGMAYGSYNTNRQFVQVIIGKKKLSALVHVNRQETDGYRNNSRIKAKDALVKLGLETTDAANFDLSFNWHEDYYGLPGALLQSELERLGRRGTVKSDDFGETRDRAISLTTTLVPFGDEHFGKFVIENSYRNRDSYGYYPSQGVDTKYNIDTYGVSGKYVFLRPDLEHEIDAVVGVDYYRNNNVIRGGQFSSDNLIISKDDLGFFVNGEYELIDKLYFNGGSRYQQSIYTFDVTQDFSGASPYYARSKPDVNVSHGGLRYQYAENSNVFADIAQTFRFLATDEWYSVFSGLNTNLKQQKGLQVQAGIKHDWWQLAQSKITGYRINNHDEIYLDPQLGGGFGANSNYDHTLRHGIEIENSFDIKKIASIDSLDSWKAGVNTTWQKSNFSQGKFKGKRIPLTPYIQNSIFTSFGFAKHWTWRWDWRYIGNRYALNDEANAMDPLKPYSLFDTRLTYEIGDVEIFGEIDNIFAQKYWSYGGKGTNSTNRNYYPDPQRFLLVGVKYKF